MLNKFKEIRKDVISKLMPGDAKRRLIREIEKCKTDSTMAVHYRFVQNLLMWYDPIKEIFIESDSSPSEMKELERLYTYYSSIIKDKKNEVWVCGNCKKVNGAFKNTMPGVSKSQFVSYLLTLIDACPLCGSACRIIVAPDFLITNSTIENCNGVTPDKQDETANALEFFWISSMGKMEDIKSRVQLTTKLFGKNALKDIIREGKIQGLVIGDKSENLWSFFGKLTSEKVQKLN